MNEGLKELINFHKQLRPSLTVQDVYKILYQGIMGPQHIIIDREKALSELKTEFESINTVDKQDEHLL